MPIQGKKKIELTKEAILERTSSYDIYRHFFGNFKLNEVTCNHLRSETNPSIIIGTKVGNDITHKDFGDYRWRGSCFDLVCQKYDCDFHTALKIIDKELNLGISQEKVKNFNPVTWEKPKNIEIKKPPFIQVITRKPTKEELSYWATYGLNEDDLKENNIFFPKTIYRNRQKLPNSSLLTFCYFYPSIGKVKLYRPHAPKRNKNTPPNMWKWDNSGIPFDYCEGLEDINNCKFSFLTKSRKDRITLRKVLGTNCVADVQAEDPSCISDNTINHLKQNSEIQVTIFDSDKKGKESSMWLTKEHQFKHCNVPDKYLSEGITDFADLFRVYGEKVVLEHFKNKGFL